MKLHPRFDGANLDSAEGGGTAKMALSSGQRVARDTRSRFVRRRRWRFRPVRELDSTKDRGKFIGDDGASAGGRSG